MTPSPSSPKDEVAELELLIGKHDAYPRASWHKVDDNTLQADSDEAAYQKWLHNFATDILSLKDKWQREAKIEELKRISKLTAGKSETPENRDNQTWQGGFNFARNNLKKYKLDRIRELQSTKPEGGKETVGENGNRTE